MVVQLAAVPLVIRIIGLEEYGLWALVSAVVGLVGLIEGGLSTSTTVFASRDLARRDWAGLAQTITVALGSMIGLATLVAAVLALGSGVVGKLFSNLNGAQQQAVTSALCISAIVVWARLIQQVFVGIEQAYDRYGIMNTISTAQQILMSLGVLAIAWMGGRIEAFMKWQVAVSASTLLAHAAVIWRLVKPSHLEFCWNAAKWREISSFSLLFWVSSLGTAMFAQCDRLIVGRLLGSELLGVYAAITGMTLQINSVSALPAQPLVPLVASAKANDRLDDRQIHRRIREMFEMSTTIAFGLGTALFLLAPTVLKLLLPATQSVRYVMEFQIACVIYSLYSINAVGYYLLYGMQAVRKCMLIQLSAGGIALALIGFGAHGAGLKGAIYGGAGYLIVWILTFLGMRRIQVTTREWTGWLLPYLLCFGGILAVGVMSSNTLFAQVVSALLGSIAIGGCFLIRNERYLVAIVKKVTLR